MALTEYKRKRDFSRTPEPAPTVARRPGWSYTIQKHAASHLHYDFRLELDGVLKSWAVPKGPSLDPAIKRLAMQVEDHPVEYGNFEGTIPQGEYGGGTVLLWDTGNWEPIGDPDEGYRQGKLKFQLQGEKLTGAWTLVRTRQETGKSPQWLLIKEKDQAARPIAKGDILADSPLSVASGRDLEQIAAAADRVWSSKPTATSKVTTRKATTINQKKAPPAKPSAAATSSKSSSKSSKLPTGAVKQLIPSRIEVQLATLTQDAPEGDEWLHEVKFDGYRMICVIDGKQVRFVSRNHQDWSSRMGSLTQAAAALGVKQAVIDGEVVVMKPDGITDFQALQNAFRDGNGQDLQYYVFDLLYLNGYSLTEVPLEQRKETLAGVLSAAPSLPIHYSDHVCGSGENFQAEACKLHLEGSISKLRNQPYRPGRGYDWLKVKCAHKEEFVIGGFTEASGSRVGFGALLMGYYDADQELRYAGKVGTGFDQRELRKLHDQLRKLEQAKSPFIDRVAKTGDIRTAHWIRPTLVAQIKYGSRTREGILRHAVYEGLREDKPAKEVKLDIAMPTENAVEKTVAPKENASKAKMTAAKKTRAASSKSSPASTSTTAAYDATNDTFAGVRLTHPDKVLYAEVGITKLELAEYYQEIAEWMLPHVRHRPIVLVRCPDGQGKECFYQKHPSVGTPAILRQIPIRESDKTENYVVLDDAKSLIALAQVGALEIHAWGSLEDKLEQPDRLVFDLDPSPEVPWARVVESAREIRQFLEQLGLVSFVKTTGGKGLHLVVPIARRHGWDEAKALCKGVAEAVVQVAPDKYTSNMSKAVRTNKIFLDYLRNGRGATAVVPYSPRSRPTASVSTPLTWKELSPEMHSDHFTIRNCRERLSALKTDPWEGIAEVRQSLSNPIKTLKKLGVLK